MKNKGLQIAVALVLIALIIGWLFSKQSPNNTSIQATNEIELNLSNIRYSKHAQCRMDCRHIDKEEIKDILMNGKINHSRTKTDSRGVTYAYEGRTRDDQMVRIVVAPSTTFTTIVTVIDLKNEWRCECP